MAGADAKVAITLPTGAHDRMSSAEYRRVVAGAPTAAQTPASRPPPRAPRRDEEHVEQRLFFDYLQLLVDRKPELEPLILDTWANPSGGKRGRGAAGKIKAEGGRRGVPDVTVAVPRAGFHGLYVENKTRTGRLEPEQRDRLARLAARGYRTEVCRSWMDLAALWHAYLGVPFDQRLLTVAQVQAAARGRKSRR